MKPLYLILACFSLTGCLKAGIAPVTPQKINTTVKADSLTSNTTIIKADKAATYDWYNGTTGTALIQVTCNDCNAIATIGTVSTPFLFNEQGVGELKYTPAPGLKVYIAVCPGSIKAIKTNIFDAANNLLYTYSAVSGNWNTTYTF